MAAVAERKSEGAYLMSDFGRVSGLLQLLQPRNPTRVYAYYMAEGPDDWAARTTREKD